MSVKAKAIMTLYRAKRINLDGVRQAAKNSIITAEEFAQITGQSY